MILRFERTYSVASVVVIGVVASRYAMTMVTLRLMPARQWTRTLFSCAGPEDIGDSPSIVSAVALRDAGSSCGWSRLLIPMASLMNSVVWSMKANKSVLILSETGM